MKTIAAESGIGRKRDRYLVDALIRHAAEAGGKLTEDVCLKAIAEAWESPRTDPKKAKAVIQAKLKNPNIRAALADIYEDVGNFSTADAIKKHVEHIEGIEHDVVIDGQVVRVQDKPSYAALKDLLNMTLPMPAKKLEVGMAFSLGPGFSGGPPPPTSARAIGPAVVEDVVDARTVELEGDDEP